MAISGIGIVLGAALIVLSLTRYAGVYHNTFEFVGAAVTAISLFANFWSIAAKEIHSDLRIAETRTKAT